MRYALSLALLAILISPQLTTAIELDEEPMEGQENIAFNVEPLQFVEDFSPVLRDPTLPEMTVSAREASVRSTLKVFENGRFIGSGTYTLIDGIPYMITANHVVDLTPGMATVQQGNTITITHAVPQYTVCNHPSLETSVQICTQLDPSAKDTVIYEDLDIRMDRLEDTLPIPAAVVNTNPDWNYWDTVYMTGYPDNVLISVAGEIVGYDRGTRFVYLDIPGWFGSSGSGIYNTDGELIGVFHSVRGGLWPMVGGGVELLEGQRRASLFPRGFPSD